MRLIRYPLVGCLLLLMTGCAAYIHPQSDAEYRQSIAQAVQNLQSDSPDKAVAQFQELARRNPSRGEPWSYIAKIRFDEQKYGEAIVAADEALNRDPKDFTAKTVRTVGGLRVAMQSLADLRSDALLASNARADAVALAASMRETLGQDILFPDGRRPKPRSRQPPKRTDSALPATALPTAASVGTASANSGPVAQPDPAASPSGRAPDPFGNLLMP